MLKYAVTVKLNVARHKVSKLGAAADRERALRCVGEGLSLVG